MNRIRKISFSTEARLLLLATTTLSLGACGHDFQSNFAVSPDKPAVNTGYNPACVNPAATPTPSPTPSPSPIASPGAHSHHFPCNWLPHLLGCKKSDEELTAIPLCNDPNAIYPTTYCQVDASGNPSADVLQVTQEEHVHVLGGGCINRPIREVWGAVLNYPAMKPDDVNDYSATYRPDLVDPSRDEVFAFYLVNTVHALGGLVNPSWTVLWYHAVKIGTFEDPKQIAINYAKIDGTSHINYQSGGWVLERVSSKFTSFAIDQEVSADRYDINKGTSDFNSIIGKLRSVTPDMSLLDAASPVTLPSPTP